MHLIDTDILVFALRQQPQVLRNFQSRAALRKRMSVISYGELLYGAARSARPQDNAQRVLHIASVIPVIDVTSTIMETFASIKSELASLGVRLEIMDLLIAATARSLDCVLVTNNERHFSKIPGLRLENWTRPV